MIFLDTDVLIDFLQGRPTAVAFVSSLRERGEPLATTCINAAELYRGAHEPGKGGRRLKVARDLVTSLTEVPFGPRAADRFGILMAALDASGARLPTPDGLVAAIVLENGGRLATGNSRDFQRVPGLEVIRPVASAP